MSRSKNRKIADLISGGTFDDGVVAASEVTGLHTVASTGDFNELENKPAPFDPAADTTFMRKSANSDLDMNNNDIVGVNNIYHEGDSNTYMGFHSADQFRVVTGGSERFEINSSRTQIDNLLVTGTATFSGSVVGLGALFAISETITTDRLLSSNDDKKVINCTGIGVTVSLPPPLQGLVYGITTSGASGVGIAAYSASTKVGSYSGKTYIEAGNSAILTCDGTNWSIIGGSGKIGIKVVQFPSSGTYTPSVGVVAFLACCVGSTAATQLYSSRYKTGVGGGGYSEKFFSSPASSYPVVIGAGGPTSNTASVSVRAGGTTTFDTISIPSSEATYHTRIAGDGALGTGGDFNARGGRGGDLQNSTSTYAAGGSGGGSATRAGDGGAAGTSNYLRYAAGSGGTGGNAGGNATSSTYGTGGAAATSEDAGVYGIQSLANPVFSSGQAANTYVYGVNGASSYTTYEDAVTGDTFVIGSTIAGQGTKSMRYVSQTGYSGFAGHITIVEFYA